VEWTGTPIAHHVWSHKGLGETHPLPEQTLGSAPSLSVLSTLAFDDGLHGLLRLSLTLVSAAPHHLQGWRAIVF
jgi:hypothetical protein